MNRRVAGGPGKHAQALPQGGLWLFLFGRRPGLRQQSAARYPFLTRILMGGAYSRASCGLAGATEMLSAFHGERLFSIRVFDLIENRFQAQRGRKSVCGKG